ncbi:MAG: hypothetical protein ABSF08_01100 [Candidatus Cybelea sp.]
MKRAALRVLTLLFTAYAAIVLVSCQRVDSAVIVNSGSTNSPATEIVVRSDGTASIASGTSGPKPFTIAKGLADLFFAALAAARKDNAPSGSCAKSASFGSTIVVKWRGWVSSDVTCPPNDMNPAVVVDSSKLNNRVMEISALAGRPPN